MALSSPESGDVTDVGDDVCDDRQWNRPLERIPLLRSGLIGPWYLHVGIGPYSMVARCRQYTGAAATVGRCPLWVDTVEKGQNEPIEIFACAPVETDSS
jgi:hypothetical protein